MRRRRETSRALMLAGWLFADLFLVLVIVGLAALPAKPVAPKPTTPSSSPAPSPSPSPPRPHPTGLNPHHIDFTINLSPDTFRAGAGRQLVQKVNTQLVKRGYAHRRVGFVLVFAAGDTSEIELSDQTATKAYRLLRSASPLFSNAAGLGYWTGLSSGKVFQFKVFLLN